MSRQIAGVAGVADIVLVVEDEDAARAGMEQLLRAAGYEAVGAPNGQAALELLRSGLRAKVILLDLMMPVAHRPHSRHRPLGAASRLGGRHPADAAEADRHAAALRRARRCAHAADDQGRLRIWNSEFGMPEEGIEPHCRRFSKLVMTRDFWA